MNRHLFLSIMLSAAALAGCSRDVIDSPEEESGNVKKFTVIATDSKTHLGELSGTHIPVLFDATDALWISASNGSTGKFTTSAEDIADGGATATFTGTLDGDGPFYAIFPYGYAGTPGENLLTVNVPATQEYVAGSFGKDANISAAVCGDGATFALKNLCGCLKTSFKGDASVSKIVLTDNDAASPLWGKCEVLLEGGSVGDISFINEDAARNVLTMTMSSPVALDMDTASDFWFIVPDGAFAKGFTMAVYAPGDVLVKSFSTDKDHTVSRSKVHNLETLDLAGSILFSGGAGTEDNPYRIANVQDLKDMASYVNTAASGNFATAHYSQTKDIEGAALVDHIGNVANNFQGTYDGNGYKITDITFSAPTAETGQGLFGTIQNATISNVNVEGYSNTAAQKYHGVIAGCITNSVVEGCTVSGTVLTLQGAQAGGIVGRNSTNSTISGCKVLTNISGTAAGFGGITGLNASGARVMDCTVVGNVTQTGSVAGTGGIAGYCESNQEDAICNCKFSGTVSSPGASVGGILGYKNNRSSSIHDCTVIGTISGGSNVGGIMGGTVAYTADTESKAAKIVIKDCDSSADIVCAASNAGGIAGYSKCGGLTVDGCIARGNIDCNFTAGGIVGMMSALAGTKCIIVNCAYLGSEIETRGYNSNGYSMPGGICGWMQAPGGLFIVNNVSRVQTFKTVTCTKNCPAGILGTQTTKPTAGADIYGCYSTVKGSGFYIDGTASLDSSYGGIYGIIGNPAVVSVNHCFYDSSVRAGFTSLTTTMTKVQSFSDTAVLLANLNEAATNYNGGTDFPILSKWVMEDDGYPMLSNFSGKSAGVPANGQIPPVSEVGGDNWQNL